MNAMRRDVLQQVPFIDLAPSDGRAVFLQPYYDESENTFKLFLQKDDELTFVYAEPVEACYWARSAVDQASDLYIPLIDVVSKHYSYESTLKALLSIIRDILNMSVALEKHFIFLDIFRKNRNPIVSGLMATELEYFFGNVRSMYDLMQGLLNDLWKRKTKQSLRESFREMVQQAPTQLKERYGLPDPVIRFYNATKQFFYDCRAIRDGVYHRGLGFNIIFCLEDGFAFQKDLKWSPMSILTRFDIWPPEKVKKNNLVSVLALISHVIRESLKDLEEFSSALIKSIEPLDPLSKNYRIFLRGQCTHHLLRLDDYLDKQWI